MRLISKFLCAAAGVGVAAVTGAVADTPPSAFDAESAIRYSQAAIGREVGDYVFLDRNARPLSLAAYRGKPLVINLVYTGCAHSCPIIVQTLADAVAVAQDALGEESFSVATIGFDTEVDTPARMRAYARRQGVDFPNWEFLSADEKTIAALSEDLGFIYFASAKGFDHLAQTTILDADGKIYRQVYGATFEAPAVVEPLKDLVFGRGSAITSLGDVINRVRLFCTLYDPARERYSFDYSIFIALTVGFLSLITLATIVIRNVVRLRKDIVAALRQ